MVKRQQCTMEFISQHNFNSMFTMSIFKLKILWSKIFIILFLSWPRFDCTTFQLCLRTTTSAICSQLKVLYHATSPSFVFTLLLLKIKRAKVRHFVSVTVWSCCWNKKSPKWSSKIPKQSILSINLQWIYLKFLKLNQIKGN